MRAPLIRARAQTRPALTSRPLLVGAHLAGSASVCPDMQETLTVAPGAKVSQTGLSGKASIQV